MKNQLKAGLFAVALVVLGAGCVSYGGSYEKHYSNPLANSNEVIIGTNGQPQAVINGAESYEHHSSYDINPLVWIGSGLKCVLGALDSGNCNEIIVAGPIPSGGCQSYNYGYGGGTCYSQGVVVSGGPNNYCYGSMGPGGGGHHNR